MKIKFIYSFILILFVFIIVTGCGSNDETGSSATSSSVEYLADTGSFTYTKDLGSSPKDVYFIFTNTYYMFLDYVPAPTISYLSGSTIDSLINAFESSQHEDSAEPDNRPLIIDNHVITEFNKSLPSEFPSSLANQSLKSTDSAPSFDTIGETAALYDYNDVANTIQATCRKVARDIQTTYGTKTLNIWVADDCWEGSTSGKSYLVTQDMVDLIADKFLKEGLNNDIYDWVTNIFGEEYGPNAYTRYLISPNDEITIFLYDIDDDDIAGQSGSFIVGYFYGRDNFIKYNNTGLIYDYSNERVMMCLDAVLLANPVNSTGDNDNVWEVTDYWPQIQISALAHEFQHMIHYYQRNVFRNVSSMTWINEMCSLATEDMLADKLNVNGPRGVSYDDPTAGSPGNTAGRLPLYNYWNNVSVNYTNDTVLKSYSSWYAFGAYLARNYGGSLFFRNIVQCDFSNYDQITNIVSQIVDSDTTMGDILAKWGVANLLSDDTNAGLYVRYNSGTWFTDSLGYNLGSINLYNYYYKKGYFTGPWFFSDNYPISGNKYGKYLDAYSNTYFRAAKGATGINSWNMVTDSNVKTTVVIKSVE